jgi:hypothetical protein
MKRYYFCIFFIFVQLVVFSLEIKGQNSLGALPVEYCDLIKNPEVYDGKEVTLRATYRYGFEWQEIYCLECRNLGKTWLEIWDLTKKSKKILKKFPKNDGTINAIFTGIFQSSKGPFGDGGYRYRFLLKEISQAELVTKSGADPNALAKNEKEKLCQR